MPEDEYTGPERRHADTRSDHDLLIRIDTRLELLEKGVGEIRSDTMQRLALMDGRVRDLEDLVKEYDPEKLAPRFEATALWVDRFKDRWVWIVGIVTIVAALLGDVLNILTKLLHLASVP